jgi:predicted RNase H-like nuclease (RuvC/YqgF family)
MNGAGSMFVQFYDRAIQTKVDEAGLPFYENQLYVIIARDSTNQVDRKADQNDIDRFPDHYAAYARSHEKIQTAEGLIVEMWPLVNSADVANLKSHGYHTVQQLARVDAKTKSSMPSHIAVLVEQAKNYVKVAGDTNKIAERIEELSRENQELREEIAILRSQQNEAA